MSTNDLFSGASVLASIKASHEVRDENGQVLEKTPGELVVTNQEILFLEVKGLFKKEKKRLHGFLIREMIGHNYEWWSGGPATLYLTSENEAGTQQTFIYSLSKKNYEKFIETLKKHNLF
jgi:hypothetical protein